MTSMEPTQLLDVINLWCSGQVCVTHRVLKEQKRGERKGGGGGGDNEAPQYLSHTDSLYTNALTEHLWDADLSTKTSL